MRTISLSSRLQWAFRGTVLQGALATGDVDNDGCNEFVVGSVQGELAVFRGRGGCGSWKHSESQAEPEYDCWDAVMRGEIPPDPGASRSELGSLRRPSTHNSASYGAASNRESLSVDDIMHMIDSGERAAISEAGGVRSPSLVENDAEYGGHIKWEDMLDIERDGRKPWILAQNLGTISSVVVADISNSGHNSIVVVNGEGKCHVFDYPFRRRLHPDLAKRRRQQNHLRRFSQDRFFKDGIVVDARGDDNDQPNIQQFPARPGGSASVGATVARGSGCLDSFPQQQPDAGVGHGQGQRVRMALSGALADTGIHSAPQIHPDGSTSMSAGVHSEPKLSHHSGAGPLQRAAVREIPPSPAAVADGSRPMSTSANSGTDFAPPRASWRPLSGLDSQLLDAGAGAGAGLLAGYSMVPTSNVSSQTDPPLTMLNSRAPRTAGPAPQADSSILPDLSRLPASPLGLHAHHMLSRGGFSADTGDSSHRHANVAESSMEPPGAVFGDVFAESDMDSADELSDSGEAAWLTPEEVADIEKIWGADVGKRSGDWFPYVLDRPDASFDIPTNVEHALVADIDNNGLNELVLTSTDGFVYIFRIEPAVKHVVKAALTPLGTFSNIPTALPSVNMTATGSPYLYMSAPRSPDSSDMEMDGGGGKAPGAAAAASTTAAAVHGTISQNGRMHSTASEPLLHAAGSQTSPQPTPVLPALAEAPSDPTTASSPGRTPDVSLVNHLLRSLREASSGSGEPSSSSSGFGSVSAYYEPDAHLAAVATAPPALTQQPQPQSQQPQTSGKRASLTSRMRESFSYIVSGAEAPRKPTSMFNQTAPPSLSHSQAHTANHSGISTSEHSRKPSSVDHTIDPGLLDKSLGGLEAERESLRLALKAPCTVEASPVVAAGETQASKRRGRPRHNTVCVDYRGMEPMRGVAGTDGGDLPRIPESMSGPSFTQSPEAPAAMQDKPAAQDVEPHASPPPPPRRVPGSRMHSRHSSVSSVAGRLRKMSDAPNDADLEALATEEDASKGSTSLDPGASQHLAPPSAAVRAKGSASKPRRAQRAAARAEPIEDRASLMSQVTERLEGLNLRSAGLRAAGPGARARRGSTYADAPENEAGPQLPPARTVVDWSFTTADKVLEFQQGEGLSLAVSES